MYKLGKSRLLGLILSCLMVSGFFVSFSVQNVQPATAVDTRQFDPGNIIDDSLFFNKDAMTEAEIQAFLNAKVRNCISGFTCLKDYRETTRTIPATPMCTTYQGGANESAARIIFKVAQACGISPRVILVTLQKEQSLVTHTSPSGSRYRSAMGAGCPDTAPCDAEYYGFFNQVHYGAYLFKRYTQPPGTGAGTSWPTRFDLRYPVGQTSAVLYHPNRDCGTQNVFIRNQATHALYIYTPYTPNQAAINAGYGLGNSCSSYGNRNFFNYYTEWFGSTRGFDVTGEIATKYSDSGGATGVLGYVSTPQYCGLINSGCWQGFQNGFILYSPATGAQIILKSIHAKYASERFEMGWLGYPTSDTTCGLINGGCWQSFQNGFIIFSPATGAQSITLDIRQRWGQELWEYGWLGYPTTSSRCDLVNGGCWQGFQNGFILFSPATGAQAMRNEIRIGWARERFEMGWLGYPTNTTQASGDGGYTQNFQGGRIIWTNSRGITTLR